MKINLTPKNVLALALLSLGGNAYANSPNLCQNPGFSFIAPNVTIQNPNVSIGSPVTPWFGETTIPNAAQCSTNITNTRDWRFIIDDETGRIEGTYRIDGKDYTVFSPSLGQFVGTIYEFSALRGGSWQPWVPLYTGCASGSTNCSTMTTGHSSIYGVRYRIRLVKLRDITSASFRYETVTFRYSPHYDYRYTSSSPWSSSGAFARITAGAGTVMVNTPTCDLATGDVNRTITLPDVRVSDFTGSSTGARSFELTANCNNASSVTFSFSGTADVADGYRFRNAATGSGASNGAALWLYDRIGGGNNTIRANGTAAERRRTVAVSGNRAVLPLGAAYWKTGAVTKGRLTTPVTVTITYN